MKDLEWLARNIDLKLSKCATRVYIYKDPHNPSVSYYWLCEFIPSGAVAIEKVLAKRAELINKPDFLPRYPWMAQDSNGQWCGYDKKPELSYRTWHNYSDTKVIFQTGGEVLDNWKESLCFNNESTVSEVIMNKMNAMPEQILASSPADTSFLKDASGRAEWSGEGLPPVGTVCQCFSKNGDTTAEECRFIESDGKQAVIKWSLFNQGGYDVVSLHFFGFRHVKPKHTKNLEKINDIINQVIINEKPLERAAMIMKAIEDD